MSTFGYQSGVTLKSLLENPNLQNPLLNFDDSKKDGKDSPQYDMGSAFLGPNLWDKTYDLDDFKLEYMDLDEFLSENGIPVAAERQGNHSPVSRPSPVKGNTSMPPSPPQQHVPQLQQPSPPSAVLPPSPEILSQPISPAFAFPTTCPPATQAGDEDGEDSEVSESDLALSRIPGQDEFDPRKHKFSDDDLKPQPMIKKSKKVFVPDCAKDDRYWCRRKKNNVAAKRSRDARRVKENQIAMRASYLERENTSMKEEVEKLRRENSRLKTALSKYEPQP